MGSKFDPLLGQLRTTDSSNPSIGGAVTSATSGSVLYINSSGQLAQDNANFFWDATNHRLGIGTTGPSSALEIGGSGQITIPAGAVGTPSIRFSGSTNTGIYSSSGGIMDFAAAGSQMLRISANGFFALGNYQISAGKTFGWGSGVAGTGGNDTGISRGAAGAVYIGTGAQGGFTGTLIAGNVGIGTTGPARALEVTGVGRFSTALIAGNAFNYSESVGDLGVGNSGANSRFFFGQSTSVYGGMTWNYNATPANTYLTISADMAGGSTITNQLTLLRNGKVGIGIAAPTTPLHVVGSAQAGDLIGNSATPTIALGSAAGAGATVAIVGTNLGGKITLTSGTGVGTGTVLTMTFSGALAFPNGCSISFAAGNASFAGIVSTMYVTDTTTTVTLSVTAALALSTVYIGYYSVLGY